MTAAGETTALSAADELLLAERVARAHFFDDLSQLEIGASLGLTRYQVARLLKLARAEGMVHITITGPSGIDEQLSRRLQDALGIERVIVIHPRSSSTTVDDIGRVLAETLSEQVEAGDTVGVTWSRTTISMSSQLTRLANCALVQLGGHVDGVSGMPGNFELLLRAAQVGGGRALPILAPLVVGDRATAAAMRAQPSVATALAVHDRLDVAVISVGNWAAGGSTIYDAVPPSIRERARVLGVVGEISGRAFDADGRAVHELLDDCIIGVTLDQLRKVPLIVGTSYGAHRAEATVAIARAGLVHTLIVDAALASTILAR